MIKWIKQAFCCHTYIEVSQHSWDDFTKRFVCTRCGKKMIFTEEPVDCKYRGR